MKKELNVVFFLQNTEGKQPSDGYQILTAVREILAAAGCKMQLFDAMKATGLPTSKKVVRSLDLICCIYGSNDEEYLKEVELKINEINEKKGMLLPDLFCEYSAKDFKEQNLLPFLESLLIPLVSTQGADGYELAVDLTAAMQKITQKEKLNIYQLTTAIKNELVA